MSNRLELYLETLRKHLGRHFEPSRLDEVIAEMRSHVTLSARDAERELGLEADEAVRSALLALGPVETVAEDLVRQHRGGTSKSVWQVARLPIALYTIPFLLLTLNALATGIPGVYDQPILGRIIGLMPTLALIAFAAAVWRSRRWLVMPMFAATLGCYLLGTLGWSIPGYRQVISRNEVKAVSIRSMDDRLAEVDRQLRMVEMGAKGYLENREAFRLPGSNWFYVPEPMMMAHRVPVAFLPMTVTLSSRMSTTLSERPWNSDLAENWTQYGAAMRDQLVEQRLSITNEQKPTVGIIWSVSAFIVGSQIAVLGLTNLAVLAASNRRRRRRVRRDPHLA